MNDRRRVRPAAGRNADTGALHRTRRDSQRRLTRTIVLGTLVVAAALAWLAREFGMDTGELVDYAVASVILVLVLVGLAVLGAAALWGVKRLLQRRRGRR
jgi:high-affinity Fe2+/Pb2+ permease